MRAARNGIVTAVLTATIAVASIVPAQAQNVTLSFGQRQQVIQTYCDRYPNDYDCRGYYGGNWRQRDYDRFYNNRRSDLDPLAAGIFGAAFGAIIGGAIANGNRNNDRVVGRSYDSHVDACYARYRSYDERTDTFMGYDGVRYRCNL
ncbi:BA14K-like protein [Devosia sp. YR412]|uniref:BA14K family protein n=1 Tax=Devosia sp. YR412 TaxID=1881030 RepID=UPI0008B1057C|nr:BA14K family protein [Devosia sp. YR412]SEQ63141.1 BA14K-like protein [Devosia sp. YR412]